jgi:multicomponent K+:H+ antiporter subunit G
MIQAPDLPLWAALLVGFLILSGSILALIGSLGLVRLRSFYQRAHAPGIGATLGTALILSGSMICFSILQSRPVVHEILIGIFITITTPVTLMLLSRAALYRDRIENVAGVPEEALELSDKQG